MKFSWPFKEQMNNFRGRLTNLNKNEPLSMLSLIVIIFLDVFVLIMIFAGLDEHTSQLTTPSEYIPYQCQKIINQDEWNEKEKLNFLEGEVLDYKYRNDYYYDYDNKYNYLQKDIFKDCDMLITQLNNLKKNENLTGLFTKRRDLQNDQYSLQNEINRLTGSYDTLLLEKIADQPEDRSITESDADNIKSNVQQKRSTLNKLLSEIEIIEKQIHQQDEIQKFWGTIDGTTNNYAKSIKEEFKRFSFWFPVKKLLMEFIFLVPLFLTFLWWNSHSINKEKGLQILVSSHLLVVSFIPIFFKIIETILDIIPKKLIETIIILLESLHLIAIWHYLIIFLGIGVGILTIYIIQKKIFSKAKLLEKRLSSGLCGSCGKKLPPNVKNCPICGESQFTVCNHCHKPTNLIGNYCTECGNALQKDTE